MVSHRDGVLYEKYKRPSQDCTTKEALKCAPQINSETQQHIFKFRYFPTEQTNIPYVMSPPHKRPICANAIQSLRKYKSQNIDVPNNPR